MPDETNISSSSTNSSGKEPLFREPPPEKSFPTAAVAIAVVVVIAIVALLVVGRRGSGPAGGAAYAANLSGGRSTYLDGHIVNHGNLTVTGATVQAVFGVDGGQPQTLTAPVSIIRTRQPYVDTQPLSAAPLAPGAGADFRLIFEGVSDSWDQKVPKVQIVQVSTK
jgi:hypothetical protein